MNQLYLSKSDFKAGRSCPTKLYYKKQGYPSEQEGNEYLEFLADGGYVVGKLAQLLIPGGVEIRSDIGTRAALEESARLLERENAILYEAAVTAGGKLARIDILVKKGHVLDLIEVKSKSYDSREEGFSKDMNEYLEDVAFQAWLLQEAYPQFTVRSFLMMPDKSLTSQIEGLAGWFNKSLAQPPADARSRFRRIEVDFLFPENSPQHRRLLQENLLARIPVDLEVRRRLPEVVAAGEELLKSLSNGKVSKIPTRVGRKCFNCEYRGLPDDPRNGFLECWGELGRVAPHVSELYHAGTLGGRGGFLVEEMIAAKRVSLLDLPPAALLNSRGELSFRGRRQQIQIQHTRDNSEWISPELKTLLNGLRYPLHFIDFETITPALPFHRGMRPYEMIAFQWSCHTVDGPGLEPRHAEWLNTKPSFPNFAFARSLMELIGTEGTPMMWSNHENTVLRNILEQMENRGHRDEKLRKWLQSITRDKEKRRAGRLVDMNQLTLEHYFHPDMKGKTSIKLVLPAVWNNHPELHQIPWFRKYLKLENGLIQSPYNALSDLNGELEQASEIIKEGTGAMRAYYEITCGDLRDDPQAREKRQKMLLRYCELDTMAMVIIWTHWFRAAESV